MKMSPEAIANTRSGVGRRPVSWNGMSMRFGSKAITARLNLKVHWMSKPGSDSCQPLIKRQESLGNSMPVLSVSGSLLASTHFRGI